MASFDLDDPLGDLLSDGSDDSFFDNPKVQSKRPSLVKTAERKSVNDLFKLDSQEESTSVGKKSIKTNPAEDWLKTGTPNPISSPARSKPTKKISFEDQDDTDIKSSQNVVQKQKTDTKSPKRIEPSKKANIMQTLLGPPKDEDKTFLSLDDLMQDTKSSKKEGLATDVSHSSTSLLDIKRPQSVGIASVEKPKEGRRSRPRTANVDDPLGLFQANPTTAPSTLEIKPRQRSTIPTEEVKKQSTMHELEKKSSSLGDVPNWLAIGQKNVDVEVANYESLPATTNPSMENMITEQKRATSQIDYQNTTMALQQHESQLLMALQMKKYDEGMTDLQRKQQDVLQRQEQQFNSLLERQFAKQQIVENNIRMQQERINHHIQSLLLQPAISTATSLEDIGKGSEFKKSQFHEMQTQYEDVINNLKQKQHEEILLLEESYKKQISTLEQSTDSVENHLKTEIDALTHKNREKIEMLEEEHKAEIAKYQKKIEEMHKFHDNEIKQMRENGNRVVEEIKYEYNTVIENLKHAKTLEHSVMKDANTYSEKLDVSLRMLDINSRSLVEIQEKVSSDCNILIEAREESIRAKQKEMNQMREALMKSREVADQERAQLMSLVRNLEVKLSEQSNNAREERFALQQAAATLTARSSALDREAEFNRQSLEREREQLKVLRETILAEQEKSMLDMTEEKLKLHSDRVRLETVSKLNQNYDVEKAKVEVEAAIRVAKEATEMTDRERENLMKQVREVEILKRTLNDKESRLGHLERDLEVAMEHANRKSMLGEKALDESRMLQMNYNDKLRSIQAQISSINIREKKLAEDKITISKERLELRNNSKQMRRCGLCAVENQLHDDDNMSDSVEQDLPRFISVNDADMFRLQLQLSEDKLTVPGQMNDMKHFQR